MATINQLPSTDRVTDGDLTFVFKQSEGGSRSASMSVLKTYMSSGVSSTDDKLTQYAAPSATGFSVQVRDSTASTWLLLTPTAAFANGTLVLPQSGNVVDRQEFLINSTQSVAALVVNGNGKTVTGAPNSIAQNGFFRLRFDTVTDAWYRVG